MQAPQKPSTAVVAMCNYEASAPTCANCDYWRFARPPLSKLPTCGKFGFITNRGGLCDFWVDSLSKRDFNGVTHQPSKDSAIAKAMKIQPAQPPTRAQWNKLYAARIVEKAGHCAENALRLASLESDETYREMINNPAGAADEEMLYWSKESRPN